MHAAITKLAVDWLIIVPFTIHPALRTAIARAPLIGHCYSYGVIVNYNTSSRASLFLKKIKKTRVSAISGKEPAFKAAMNQKKGKKSGKLGPIVRQILVFIRRRQLCPSVTGKIADLGNAGPITPVRMTDARRRDPNQKIGRPDFGNRNVRILQWLSDLREPHRFHFVSTNERVEHFQIEAKKPFGFITLLFPIHADYEQEQGLLALGSSPEAA